MRSASGVERISAFWSDRPCLVTGATGLVGSWLVKRLVAVGADLVCLVRDWVPKSELVRAQLLDNVTVVRGDIRDRNLLERILGEFEITTVFHLAAQTLVPVASRNPVSTLETNIAGTWSLLEACRRSALVRAVVIASSDKAYGPQPTLPYTEDTPLQARHPYDVSKACADLIAQSFAATYNLPVAISRCGNFYGGGDLNWSRIVPGTIRALLRSRRPVIRSDGTLVRDYFYVEDAANGYMLLSEHLTNSPELSGQAFNFSNQEPVSVLELVQRISRLMQSDLEPEIQNEAKGEIHTQTLNAAKARQILGWQPLFSLEEGLTRTIEWYRSFFQGPATLGQD